MLLVTCHTGAARRTLRNVCRHHDGTVVERLGGAALLLSTHWGLFLALRLREKHGDGVRISMTYPVEEEMDVPATVMAAAVAYERRRHPETPYSKFAAGTDHPAPDTMKRRRLKPKRRRGVVTTVRPGDGTMPRPGES